MPVAVSYEDILKSEPLKNELLTPIQILSHVAEKLQSAHKDPLYSWKVVQDTYRDPLCLA
jgi:hypothetical protein